MPRVAIVGNAALDVVDGGPPTAGGCPTFAVEALRRLGREGQIVTRFASDQAATFAPTLERIPGLLTVLPAASTSGFSLDYDGDDRAVVVTAIGPVWSAADAGSLDPSVEWVHAAPLLRSDFPTDALAAFAVGRRLSLDAQGLVRVSRAGPLLVDAAFDPELLEHVTALKLSEEEAAVVTGGCLDLAAAMRLGVPEILVTRGSHGVLVVADGRVESLPAVGPVAGVQTTGAGDMLMVAYAVARTDGAGPVEAARAGCHLVAEVLEARRAGRG